MKKGTKKIAINAMNEEIRRLNAAIAHCRGTYPANHPHVIKLGKKVDVLLKAITEVEAC